MLGQRTPIWYHTVTGYPTCHVLHTPPSCHCLAPHLYQTLRSVRFHSWKVCPWKSGSDTSWAQFQPLGSHQVGWTTPAGHHTHNQRCVAGMTGNSNTERHIDNGMPLQPTKTWQNSTRSNGMCVCLLPTVIRLRPAATSRQDTNGVLQLPCAAAATFVSYGEVDTQLT